MDDMRFSVNNPLRPVDSRSRVAENFVRTARFPSRRVYDQATCEIAAYLQIRRRSDCSAVQRDPVAQRYADLHQAYELREAVHPRLRAAVEAMLLTEIGFDVIASRSGVGMACVGWYAAAFFDVRDRLASPHFIVNHVIEDCRERSGDDWCQHGWKLVAYLGGDTALQEAIGASKATSLQHLIPLLRQETQFVLQDKARRLAYKLSGDSSGILAKLLQTSVATDKSSEAPVSDIVQNVQAMLELIPFEVGERADPSSPLAEFDHCAVDLNANDEMLLAMGFKLPHAEMLKALKFPEPST